MSKEKTDLPYIRIFLILALLILLLAVLYAFIWLGHWQTPETAGVAGDMFGALTSFFTGLAFAGVIVTMIMQNRDLRLQREELQYTRQVLQDQKDQMTLQVEQIEKQNFEMTFFRMLENFRSEKEKLQYGKYIGAGALSEIKRVLEKDHFTSISTTDPEAIKNQMIGHYQDIYDKPRVSLGPYYRSMYHIIKLVTVQKFSNSEKQQYCNLVRAALDSSELALLCLNGLSRYAQNSSGFLIMKEYINTYNLLKHFRERDREIYQPVLSQYTI